MRLVQFLNATGDRRVGLVRDDTDHLEVLDNTESVYRLALDAIAAGGGLGKNVTEHGWIHTSFRKRFVHRKNFFIGALLFAHLFPARGALLGQPPVGQVHSGV